MEMHGKEATIVDDGFYSSSKKHLKKYANQNRLTAQVTLDENNLRLYLRRGKLLISVAMLYGNEVISRFFEKQLSLDIIMDKFFQNCGMIIGWYSI